jgi:chemotaxis signal transduction protein
MAARAEQAQGIVSGGVPVALPYAWARQVVDVFSINPIPLAPAWLAGAANVEGRIVAVVDIGTWALGEAAPEQPGVQQRLLLGGRAEEEIALRFQGLPTQLQVQPGAAAPLHELPPRLHAYATGQAGDRWPLLDMTALALTWAQALRQAH